MPSISIVDSSSAIVDATILDTSLLGKTPSSILRFVRDDIVGALSQPLDQVQIKSLTLGFNWRPSVIFAGGSATFIGGPTTGGELDLYKPSPDGKGLLFASDQFGRNVPLEQNFFLALSFHLAVGATPAGTPGAFTLTLVSSAAATAKLYLPFGPAADKSFPTLKHCLETLLSAYTLPSKLDDIIAMPSGAVFTFDTLGSLGFTAALDLLAAVNPTASPGFSAGSGPLKVTAGPSVTVSGGFTLSGEFQVRLWKRDDHTLELGYFKKQGSSFTVDFDAAAAVGAKVGGYDILATVYGLLGDSGKLDPAWLKAHVPDAVADEVSAAYKAAVQKKLSIEFDAECDTSLTDEAAFSWSFDLSPAATTAHTALLEALHGNISPLLTGPPPAGVTSAGSVLDKIRTTKRAFTFNFLGLYDHASIQEATLTLSTRVSDDGQLIFTDQAHLVRLSADATPFIKAAPLQSVIAEDCVATVGYAAAFGHFIPQLQVAYSYFSLKTNARTSDLALFLDTAAQLLGKDQTGPWAQILQAGARSQTASLLAALTYDVVTAKAIFLDASGNPRDAKDFQSIGRQALLLTPGLGLNPAFTQAMHDDAKWQALLNAGSPDNVYLALGADATNPPLWAKLSFDWLTHVSFWASAMHDAGGALEAISQYLAQHPDLSPIADTDFQTRRQSFATKLQSAIKKTPMFDDSLGIITLSLAATPAHTAATVSYAAQSITS